MGADKPACWEVKRDHFGKKAQLAEAYFDETRTGAHCDSNWYEGNPNWELGDPDVPLPPYFTAAAPAVLGFDETIDEYCAAGLKQMGEKASKDKAMHAENCVRANLNILALYGERLPYNLCRNLEWMVCAAKGILPGQGGNQILFAKHPWWLFPDGRSGKPLNQCCGWAPDGVGKPESGVYGYTTDDIYYLEICLINEICENGADVFKTDGGQAFRCKFSDTRFRALQEILLSPWAEPSDARKCKSHKVCDEQFISGGE